MTTKFKETSAFKYSNTERDEGEQEVNHEEPDRREEWKRSNPRLDDERRRFIRNCYIRKDYKCTPKGLHVLKSTAFSKT